MSLKWMDNVQRVTNYFQEVVVTEGQNLITLNRPFVKGFNMLLVTVNGKEISPSDYTEYDDHTLQFPENYLELGDCLRIYYLPNTLSLGDIRVVGKFEDLSVVTNPQYNEVALSIKEKRFYIYRNNQWEEFILPFTSQNVGVLFSYENQEVTSPSNKLIEFQKITYPIGANALLVFVDDNLVDPSKYLEVNSQSILFKDDLPLDNARVYHEIEIVAGNNESWEDSNNHHVDYTYDLDQNIQTEVVTVGMTTIRSTTYTYDGDGNIITETIVKGSKTVTKTYGYDIEGNILSVDVVIS